MTPDQVLRAFELGLISKSEARRLLGLDAEQGAEAAAVEELPTPPRAQRRPVRTPRRRRRTRVAFPERPAWLAYLADAYAEAAGEEGSADRDAIADACRRYSVGTQDWPAAGDREAVVEQVNRFFGYWSDLAAALDDDSEAALEEALDAFSEWLTSAPAPGGGLVADQLIDRWLQERR